MKPIPIIRDWLRGYALIAPAILFAAVFLCVPLLLTVALSFWTQNGFSLDMSPTLKNYTTFIDYQGSPIYLTLLWRSLLISAIATLGVLLLAYPAAYFIAFGVKKRKYIWIILITIPFWTSYLLRIFSWKIILGYNGVINSSLMQLHIIDKPLEFILYNPTAVTVTLAHAWAAYAILPIYVSLEKIDRSLLEASIDLGDSPAGRLWRIVLPLSMPGTIAAALFVFIPTVGDYVTPNLVGGPSGIMIGNIIQSLLGKGNDAPMAAAAAICTMLSVAFVATGPVLLARLLRKHR